MTAKEKANELVKKFEFIDLSILSDPDRVYRECARICVREILDAETNKNAKYDFYEEVMEEIDLNY